MAGKYNSGIYKITNTINGKMYIGSSADLLARKSNHFSKLRKGKHPNAHLQSSFCKYGHSAFLWEALIYCSPDSLIFYEQIALDALKVTDNSIGYNMRKTAETNRGIKLSDETKRKMSRTRKGRKGIPLTDATKQKLREANTGKIISEATKKKISKALKGRKRPQHVIDAICASNRGRKRTNEEKRKISNALKGKKLSEDTIKKMKETRRRKSKLSIEQVIHIKEQLAEGNLTGVQIAKNIGVSVECVYSIKKGKSWVDIVISDSVSKKGGA